jgi:His-Xaa-Ser system radical SAM maturase HxsC
MHLHSVGRTHRISTPIIGKVTAVPIQGLEDRKDYIAYLNGINRTAFGKDLAVYAGLFSPNEIQDEDLNNAPRISGCPNLEYVSDGDVLLLLPSGTVNVLYRRSSAYNAILTTERCNSLCLMCSQPPRAIDDSYRVRLILRLIDLIDSECKELGITGGEPTLLGENFLAIIRKLESRLPNTSVHVLSNGRLFKNGDFAERLGTIGHHDLMMGIPLYSDLDVKHDYVVQAKGAFDETILGLYNLARCGVAIEIRVVLHKQTYGRLPQLAEFIYRNLPFASHVALMGMEMFGYVHFNLNTLWIDPFDYQRELEEATLNLALHGMNVSIYNHQLCTLPPSVWPFARRSISDWKNVYLDACNQCAVRRLCGGFFQSGTKRHSAHIHALGEIDDTSLRFLSERVGAPGPDQPGDPKVPGQLNLSATQSDKL